jgi:hypothetical protein
MAPRHGFASNISLFLLLLAACAPAQPPPDVSLAQRQSDGYGLLYNLMSDESQVGQIFSIKHADDSVGDLVRQVGDTCTAAKAKLEYFSRTDPEINLAVTNLPQIEQRSRDITASRTRNILLFSSGTQFETRLLFTQAQAMGYATALCDALREKERNLMRIEFLKTLSQESTDLHGRLMGMLTYKP